MTKSIDKHSRFGVFPDPSLTGYLPNLTPQQERSLHELRKRLAARASTNSTLSTSPVEQFWSGQPTYDAFAVRPSTYRQVAHTFALFEHPDGILLRYLRASDWNVGKAETMLINVSKWRIENDIAGIVYVGSSCTKPELFSKWFGYVQGYDRFDRPVCYFHIKKHSFMAQTSEELKRWVIYQTETARLFLKSPGETSLIICDMSGFSIKNADFNLYHMLLEYILSYYPESMGCIVMYKAPWVFNGVWKVIKPLLPNKIANIARFIDTAEELSEFVDLKYVPKEMGGECDGIIAKVRAEKTAVDDDDASDLDAHMSGPDTDGKRAKSYERRYQACLALERSTAELDDALTKMYAGTDEKLDAMLNDLKKKREEIIKEYIDSTKEIDYYIRARTVYHRAGILDNHGNPAQWGLTE
ncbi:CRAL/TRIO domain-containing protein [Ramicandelaber brevisporus]|nr:CRAL/TRIO domain-containing protein [Ramicandelaber brevisporus]